MNINTINTIITSIADLIEINIIYRFQYERKIFVLNKVIYDSNNNNSNSNWTLLF